MTSATFKKGSKKIKRVARGRAAVSSSDLVRESHLGEQSLPLVIEPKVLPCGLMDWARTNRDWMLQRLHRHGALLLRGFSQDLDQFKQLICHVAGEADLLPYLYRSTPRTQVRDHVYTSTEYPADQHIPFHNEEAYAAEWPAILGFLCVKTAREGGETPVADSRLVYEKVEPNVRQRFADKGVRYVRHYHPNLDLPWPEVFQTEDKAEVEAVCKRSGIEYEWLADGGLKTSQVCAAVRQHPVTGEQVWFNQAHLFHISNLPTDVYHYFRDQPEKEPPRNAYYGDGTPLELETLDHIRQVYNEVSVAFPWKPGDLMLVDNMLAAHSRRPFKGERRIIVGMAGLCS